MKASIRFFLGLIFFSQSIISILLSPFIANKANHLAGLFEYVTTATYLILFAAALQIIAAILTWAALQLKVKEKLVVILLVFFEVFSTAILTGSFYIYFRLGVHLDHPVVLDLARLPDGNWGVIPSTKELLMAFSALAAIMGGFVGLLHLATHQTPKLKILLNFRNSIRALVLLTILGSYLIFMSVEGNMGAVKYTSLPGGSILSQVFTDSLVVSLRDEAFPNDTIQLTKRPNLIIVMTDAFRHDKATREYAPTLHRLSEKSNCSPGGRHYAGSHLTSYGGFSLWYGMDSYLYRPITEQNRISMVLSTLRSNGYSVNAFDASGLTSYYPPVIQTQQFDHYQSFIDKSREAEEDVSATSALIESWKKRDPSKPYAGFLFLYSTHEPYYTIPSTLNSNLDSKDVYNLSVKVIDQQISRIKEILNDETVFVFTGDHGEEFGEFGSTGHVDVRFEDVRVRVPLIFCLPKHKWNPVVLSSHADIWPTIFDWSGASLEWLQKTFSGQSLLRPETARNWLPLTGAYYPNNGRNLALVLPEGKVLIHAYGTKPDEVKITGRLDLHDSPLPTHLPNEENVMVEFKKSLLRYLY